MYNSARQNFEMVLKAMKRGAESVQHFDAANHIAKKRISR